MKKYYVRVDDRERGENLKYFEKYGLLPVVCRMNVGDYVYEGLVFERKTIGDFVSSICDGRLKEQREKMRVYEERIVIVIGKFDEEKHHIHKHCVLGMMISLQMRGIKVVWVDDEEEGVWCMRNCIERYEQDTKYLSIC
jgi:ERCC4-type nuclease